MRDFPVFETQYGVASLVLREIPYRQRAYIKILDSLEPEQLLFECKGFCTAVGAAQIFASGHPILEQYPLHACVCTMECSREILPDTAARAVAVTKQTLAQWKDIYNEKMADVPNAAYMDDKDAQKLLSGGAYFVYHDDWLIGIGKAAGTQIDAVASVEPGAGQDVVLALVKTLSGDAIRLEVALENIRAVRLYGRLGFVKKEEISRWHQIL